VSIYYKMRVTITSGLIAAKFILGEGRYRSLTESVLLVDSKNGYSH
jgi:hypothetical protein